MCMYWVLGNNGTTRIHLPLSDEDVNREVAKMRCQVLFLALRQVDALPARCYAP